MLSTLSIGRRAKKSKKSAPESWIYSPEGFEPDDYPGAISQHPDAARWMLNCIYFRRIVLNLDVEEYVNLHNGLLSLVMGKTALIKPVREALEKAGLIECDHKWATGSKSLGYRIGPKLSSSTWRRYTSPSKRFLKRVQKYKAYVLGSDSGFNLAAHTHLANWVKRVQLPDDLEQVYAQMHEDKALIARNQAEVIRAGMINTSVCHYGRFHSNVCGLCRELRPSLTVDSQPLVEVDITNSQPYFLGCLLLETWLNPKGLNVGCLSDYVFQNMESQTEENKQAGRAPYDFPFEGLQEEAGIRQKGRQEGRAPYVSPFEGIPEDLATFIETTSNGTFYETLMDADDDRETIKPQIFQILYGTTGAMDNVKLSTRFKALYPTVFSMIRTIKQAKGYKWVGQELQRRESQIVIGQVCGTLATDYKNVPILTVHDSVLTTQDNLPLVKGLLAQALRATNYLTPRLRTKSQATGSRISPSEPSRSIETTEDTTNKLEGL